MILQHLLKMITVKVKLKVINMEQSSIIFPGKLLGMSTDFDSGKGTFTEGNQVFASLLGDLKTEGRLLTVVPRTQGALVTPQVGQEVLAKVKEADDRRVTLQIVTLEGKLLNAPLVG